MFLIYSAVLLAATAVLAAAASATCSTEGRSVVLQHFLGGQVFGVFLSSLMGIGLVMLFAFASQFKTQPDIVLQVIVTVALGVGSYALVRFFTRNVTSADDDATPAIGPQQHAA